MEAPVFGAVKMACNTCGHTMQNAMAAEFRRVLWCPRCGALRIEIHRLNSDTKQMEWMAHCDDPPKLVERIRTFLRSIEHDSPAGRYLKSCVDMAGVTESALPPEARR